MNRRSVKSGGSDKDPRNFVTIQQNAAYTPVMSGQEGKIRAANGNVLVWETKGSADRWPRIVLAPRGPDWTRHEGSATQFIVGVATGEHPYRLFPDDLLEGPILGFQTELEYSRNH